MKLNIRYLYYISFLSILVSLKNNLLFGVSITCIQHYLLNYVVTCYFECQARRSLCFRCCNIEARIWASIKTKYSVTVLYKLSIGTSFIQRQAVCVPEHRMYFNAHSTSLSGIISIPCGFECQTRGVSVLSPMTLKHEFEPPQK